MNMLKVGDSFLLDGTLWEVVTVFTDIYSVMDVTRPGVYRLLNSPYVNNMLTLQKLDAVHTHTMKLYQGFTDTYQYCTECNHKEKA